MPDVLLTIRVLRNITTIMNDAAKRGIIFLAVFSLAIFSYLIESEAQNGFGNVVNYERIGFDANESHFGKCHNSTPPEPNVSNNNRPIPTYVINLDNPPEERWKNLTRDMKPSIRRFMEVLRNNTDKIFGKGLFHLIDTYLPVISKSLPAEYYRELVGIAEVTELPLGEITMFNVFYEFDSLCTSIVMEDSYGTMHHGRNLDFGFMLGWDVKNRTWLVAELLRPLVIRIEFQKNSRTLFTSINFAGYIGVLTGLKKNAFSLSVNERFAKNGGFVGIIEWILHRRDQKWNGILTREVLETANTYKEAQKMLASPKLLAPTYFILTGAKSGQGCVITRGRNNVDIWKINTRTKSDYLWYLVQTNYDHWKKPPFFDNRRVPAIICLELLGRQNASYALYNVLSTIPVLNKLTVYSAIMQPANDFMDVWIQDCHSCRPW